VRRLTRFLQLDRADRWILIQSVLLLPLVAVLLRMIGLARCWALLQRAGGKQTGAFAADDPARTSQQARTVRMVDIAARHLPWQPSCLPRSLVLWFLLRRQGVPAELRIGVRKSDRQLEAHAWVEVDQRVVNDTPDIAAEYPPFENIAAALRVTP
jgi:transglutaminase superfamily protein